MNRLLQIIPAGALLVALTCCGRSSAPASPPRSAAQSASTQTYLAVAQIIPAQTIKDYLSQKEGATASGGKVFTAYQIMGSDQSGQITRLYLWVFLQEFWVGQGFLHDGTASSLPVVLFIKMQAGRYQIFDFKDAGEGYQYLTVNFPPRIQALINLPADAYNQRATQLSNETRRAAEAYFGK